MSSDAQVAKAISLITPTLKRLVKSREEQKRKAATLLFNMLQIDAPETQLKLGASLQALRASPSIRDPKVLQLYAVTKRAALMWDKALEQATRA